MTQDPTNGLESETTELTTKPHGKSVFHSSRISSLDIQLLRN